MAVNRTGKTNAALMHEYRRLKPKDESNATV